MSFLQWLVVAGIAYFANSAYQRIQLARNKADFIRGRRRAAGIPDDDQRPFAQARADALSRRSQQSRQESLSTPVKKRKVRTPSRSQSRIDHEAAARLSGIPGTLPGYLRESFVADAALSTTQRHSFASPHVHPSSSPRSPSPIKQRDMGTNSSQTSMRRPRSDRSLAIGARETETELGESPSTQRSLKRTASPTKSEISTKAPKVAVPGTFNEPGISDEAMSDTTDFLGDQVEAMDEENVLDMEEVKKPLTTNGKTTALLHQDQLASLTASARVSAKKREADELDDSDTEQSFQNSDDEDRIAAHPHSSKRSRTANKGDDPSTSLGFDIAVPEEAMTDFIPVHQVSSSKAEPASSASKAKRRVDTSDDRQPGEEWTDFEGLRWRIHPTTHELQRWSDVLEWRSKYRMPRDSLHPMAKESHQVVVSKWLTKEGWEDAKANKLLSFQEPERLAEKEKQDKEEAEKMRRKQELLAKIRETSSPNKRIQSYLAQQQRRQIQHRSSDVSMHSYTAVEGDGETASMSIDTASMMGGEQGTPGKPRSRRISLHSRLTPARGGDGVASLAGRESKSTSGASSPSDSPNRRRGSPLASPYRSIQYPPRSKKTTPANGSPLVTSFPPPSGGSL